MRNKYFRSREEASLESKFSEQQTSIDSVTQNCQQITNSGEITGFVVLTQAEYDALPASKLTDGKVYLVEEE